MEDFVIAIRQHPGPVQVTRRVKVQVPGKHFPQLSAAEQAVAYWGTAIEYKERHAFAVHRKAWGGARTGPGISYMYILPGRQALQPVLVLGGPQVGTAAP